MPREDPLSGPARDVLHELAEFARRHPDAPQSVIAWYLALRWIPGKLARRWRLR
jgi:hypothetical protein